jgi:hypothetical protein
MSSSVLSAKIKNGSAAGIEDLTSKNAFGTG